MYIQIAWVKRFIVTLAAIVMLFFCCVFSNQRWHCEKIYQAKLYNAGDLQIRIIYWCKISRFPGQNPYRHKLLMWLALLYILQALLYILLPCINYVINSTHTLVIMMVMLKLRCHKLVGWMELAKPFSRPGAAAYKADKPGTSRKYRNAKQK